jgi:hypothetical protein
MREFLMEHLVHVVAFATLISRMGDIGTTFLVTPTLRVEANPIARRLGWKFIFATAAVALVPYYSMSAGVVILTASFLAAASNATEAMLARYVGEEKFTALHREAIQTMPVLLGLGLLCLPAIFFLMLGLMMLLLLPHANNDWGFDIAMGTIAFALVVLIFYPIRFFSERRLRNMKPTETSRSRSTT